MLPITRGIILSEHMYIIHQHTTLNNLKGRRSFKKLTISLLEDETIRNKRKTKLYPTTDILSNLRENVHHMKSYI